MIVNRIDSNHNANLRIGVTGYQAQFSYNSSSGNLEIMPRSGYDTVFPSGNIGIGTTTPRANLDIGYHINNGILGAVFGRLAEGDTNGAGTYLGVRGYETQWSNYGGKSFALEHRFYGSLNSSINFYRGGGDKGGFMTFATYDGTERVRIDPAGKVGIGTVSPSHELAVNGTVRAKEVIVDTGWSDFVFEDSYRLRSLAEVETHIEEHGNLPDVPSASEVESEGLSVGKAQKIMMQKIEELTLYMIEQEKKNQIQQNEIEDLRKQLSQQNTRYNSE